MKKLLLFFTILPAFIHAQITVSEAAKRHDIGAAKQMGNPIAEIYLNTYAKGDSLYFLSFHNQKYQHITDRQLVMFKGNNTVEDFYKIMKMAFSDQYKKEPYSVSFKLGDTGCLVTNTRIMGKTFVVFTTDAGYVQLNEKQVEQLFGKKGK